MSDTSRLRATDQPHDPSPTRRNVEPTLRLLRDALGPPAVWPGKVRRLLAAARTRLDRAERRRRLDALERAGAIRERPSELQLTLLGIDMLRFFIEPGARDYYASRGIAFGLHQVLRVLDDPASMADAVGLVSERDTLIGHLLQVVHADPAYDLSLLHMFDDGHDALEAQLRAMLDGTHPRASSIGAIVEDVDYHRRLLAHVRAWRRDPTVPPLKRRAGGARNDPDFVLAELVFARMDTAFAYGARLPDTVVGALRHLFTRRAIARECCTPEQVEAVRAAFR